MSKIIIVSNRLPVTITQENDEFAVKGSAGGLATALHSWVEKQNENVVWVGWPGLVSEKKEALKEKLIEFKSHPVFLSDEDLTNYYYGFSNKTLWPLFHYFPTYAIYNEDYWTSYNQVNEKFCESVSEIAEQNDTIWVQDYQLLLLPNLLREKLLKPKIGFFLHIPFPSYEIFRMLPSKWRQDIMIGMLGSDLNAFHTNDYARHFIKCAQRILRCEHNSGKLTFNNQLSRVEALPISIDFQKFNDASKDLNCHKVADTIHGSVKKILVLSVDRLDYTKGIYNRLRGYELFLKNNPEWHRRISLALIVVPSRELVDQYQQMKKQIDEIVGCINGTFSSVDWTPIVYQYKLLSLEELIPYYVASDIALVTPLRDGMNLVAKEYIACRQNKTGVLILSEMAGAAAEMAEALIINPNNIEEIAVAIKTALEMPIEDQIRRNNLMQRRISNYDIHNWVAEFFKNLDLAIEDQNKMKTKLLSSTDKQKIKSDYAEAAKKLLLLDYDGTLIPLMNHAKKGVPPESLKQLLTKLAENATVVIISGRDKETLNNWFSDIPVALVAEHGAWIKEQDWRMVGQLSNLWKPQVISMMEKYVDRLPGSFIEDKEFSVVWHYRNCDPDLAFSNASQLTHDIAGLANNTEVLQGNKVIEVRIAGVNKGSASNYFINQDYDFVLAVGDDWTDEDMFKILDAKYYSIKVGMMQTYARFNVTDYRSVLFLLQSFEEQNEKCS